MSLPPSLSVCLSPSLSVCVSVSLSVCLPVCLSVCLSVSPCLSVCLSVCVSLSVCLCVCLSVSVNMDYSVHNCRFCDLNDNTRYVDNVFSTDRPGIGVNLVYFALEGIFFFILTLLIEVSHSLTGKHHNYYVKFLVV